MKKFFFTAILTVSFVFLAGILSETNAQTIGVTGSIGTVKRGGSIRGNVVLNIPSALHINSNTPNSKYAIPTSVRLSTNGGRVSGAVYPRGKNRKFSFSEDVINVYEGRTIVNFNLTVPANFRGNTINVRAVVRYQACTDEVCYAPKTETINITARVR